MVTNSYAFTFKPGIDLSEVEATFALAALAVGSLHGDAAVRLESGYTLDETSRCITLDAGSAAADAVVRVFAGLCASEFGDASFTARRRAGAIGAGRADMPMGVAA